MDLTAALIARADAYCARAKLSRSRLATLVVNDGKFFDRIAAGGSLTVKTYEKFIGYLDDKDAAVANDQKALADPVEEPAPLPFSSRAA